LTPFNTEEVQSRTEAHRHLDMRALQRRALLSGTDGPPRLAAIIGLAVKAGATYGLLWVLERVLVDPVEEAQRRAGEWDTKK
jgi:hypothetical protein